MAPRFMVSTAARSEPCAVIRMARGASAISRRASSSSSPADARFVWDWMDPGMPEGWYAVTAMYPTVKGTVVDVGP